MTNKGLIPGITPDGWRTYQPKQVIASDTPGGITQVILDDVFNPYQFGRYNLIDKRLCIVQMNMSVLGNTTLGAGGSYAWQLPFPALRLRQRTAEPIPIGRGMAYISFGDANTPDLCTPLVLTLADPFTSLGGQEDRFFQALCPYVTDWGSGTIANGQAAKTQTHHANLTPNAQDIEVVWLGGGAVTILKPSPRISAITSTTFDISTPAQNTGAALDFNYKIRAEPPTGQQGALASPTVPYDLATHTNTVAGNFMNWFFHLVYPIAA